MSASIDVKPMQGICCKVCHAEQRFDPNKTPHLYAGLRGNELVLVCAAHGAEVLAMPVDAEWLRAVEGVAMPSGLGGPTSA